VTPQKDEQARDEYRGPIAWMVRNRVTPNLLMIVLLMGGLFMSLKIKKEVFPNFEIDEIRVNMAYPGSSPEEVEQGIVLAVEEAISDIEGVEEISAISREGRATITAELVEGVNGQKVLQDIKQEIDRITTFPEEAEEPEVSLSNRRRFVLAVMLYGDANEKVLRELTEQVRDRLLQEPGITQADLVGVRNYEVLIEVPMENLRAYGLTLRGIADKIQTTAVELPGGSIETRGGEILLRMKERRDWANDFSQIPIVTTQGGSVLRLGDLGTVRDGFEESSRSLTYNGKPAMMVEVYRVGEQTPIGVSDAVRKSLEEIESDLPPGVYLEAHHDRSDIYRQRLELLLRNGFIGLLLVLALLGAFLEFKLAFWVTMGIPTSFLGAFIFLPFIDVSINMVSMFAFIIALGIVVDDAIIAGENIYEYRQRGMAFIPAAIQGARDIALPVSFSILTNIVAFSPLFFVPGEIGKIFKTLPLVVCMVFIISWIEALFVLPSHVAHTRSEGSSRVTRFLHDRQQGFSALFSRFIENVFGPFLDWCLRYRYMTVAIGFAFLMIVLGYAFSGRMGFILFPKVEADRAVATAILPYGSPYSKAVLVRDRLLNAAIEISEPYGSSQLVEGYLGRIDENEVEVEMHLTEPKIRPIQTGEVTRLWRDQVGQIVGLESLRFESDRGGPGRGASLTVELSHRNVDKLDQASESIAESMRQFPNVKDIDDGFTPGKEQLDFKLLSEGHSLGLTVREVAQQVRSAFYGAEALRQQRGRNEIKVMVRLPENQRVSEFDIEQLLIRTPAGRDVPLYQVAQVERGRAYTTITRHNTRRTVTVTANVEPIGETNQVMATLKEEVLPQLERDYPGLTYSFEGRQAEIRDSLNSLISGFLLAMVLVYMLLAIPFRSYIQPAIVMTAIPFGLVGAVIGHMIMGYSLSVISMMGIVALSGVVVNDALVMIDYANRQRRSGASPYEAIHGAGIRRFRPILLTTLTTFGGLAPMIFETSRQARFMIPMAISLGYGILFATAITLILVPCLFIMIEDLKSLIASRRKNFLTRSPEERGIPSMNQASSSGIKMHPTDQGR
jgi:multidrug efflux pump subunit AcrB